LTIQSSSTPILPAISALVTRRRGTAMATEAMLARSGIT
jgi:hypothetical protein